jgi:hypothetical protein
MLEVRQTVHYIGGSRPLAIKKERRLEGCVAGALNMLDLFGAAQLCFISRLYATGLFIVLCLYEPSSKRKPPFVKYKNHIRVGRCMPDLVHY